MYHNTEYKIKILSCNSDSWMSMVQSWVKMAYWCVEGRWLESFKLIGRQQRLKLPPVNQVMQKSISVSTTCWTTPTPTSEAFEFPFLLLQSMFNGTVLYCVFNRLQGRLEMTAFFLMLYMRLNAIISISERVCVEEINAHELEQL